MIFINYLLVIILTNDLLLETIFYNPDYNVIICDMTYNITSYLFKWNFN